MLAMTLTMIPSQFFYVGNKSSLNIISSLTDLTYLSINNNFKSRKPNTSCMQPFIGMRNRLLTTLESLLKLLVNFGPLPLLDGKVPAISIAA